MRHRNRIDLHAHHVLDGGLATELERRGVSLNGPLWSARALTEAPDTVLSVHRSYLQAGADVLLTASYQVSAHAFQAAGLSPGQAQTAAAAALRQSVALAAQAREESRRPGVLIAASLGPYGAALANGAEFHGHYSFASASAQHAALVRFHSERIAALAETEADLLAFETLPSLAEAQAIAEALETRLEIGAWLCFTCRDGAHTAHGEPLRACAALLESVPQVVAIGVNCTAPGLILPLLRELRAATGKPLVVYPNSGEGWDASRRCWTGNSNTHAYAALAQKWFNAGAQLVGGCCRTGPEHVRAIAAIAPGST